jgi:hypothetical protein
MAEVQQRLMTLMRGSAAQVAFVALRLERRPEGAPYRCRATVKIHWFGRMVVDGHDMDPNLALDGCIDRLSDLLHSLSVGTPNNDRDLAS